MSDRLFQMKIFGHPNNLKLKSLNYKVVDLIEYYNFDIKFVFIGII